MSRTSKRIAIIVGSIILGCVFIIVLAISVPNSSNNKGSSKETPYNAFSNSSFMGPGPVDGIPCIEGNVKPAGCKQRFVKCGSTSQVGVKDTIPPATDTACKSAKVMLDEICILLFLLLHTVCFLFILYFYSCYYDLFHQKQSMIFHIHCAVLQCQARMFRSEDGDGRMLGTTSEQPRQHILVCGT